MGIHGDCVTYNTTLSAPRWTLCALTFFSNVLTISTLLRTNQRVGSKGELYIVSLSCSDLLLCPAIGADNILTEIGFYCQEDMSEKSIFAKRIAYIVLGILFVQSLGASLLTLVSIAIDRLIAVSKPIFYKQQVTPFRIKCVVVFEWLYMFGFITFIVVFFGLRSSDELLMKGYDALHVIPSSVYEYVLKPHLYSLIALNLIFYGVTLVYIRKLDAKRRQESGDFKRTTRYLKMSGATLLTMLGLWTPYIVAGVYVDQKGIDNIHGWLQEGGLFYHVLQLVDQPLLLLLAQ
jgi:hypothetical protein